LPSASDAALLTAADFRNFVFRRSSTWPIRKIAAFHHLATDSKYRLFELRRGNLLTCIAQVHDHCLYPLHEHPGGSHVMVAETFS
jgi:hypothetical protein